MANKLLKFTAAQIDAALEKVNELDNIIDNINNTKYDNAILEGNILKFYSNNNLVKSLTLPYSESVDLSNYYTKIETDNKDTIIKESITTVDKKVTTNTNKINEVSSELVKVTSRVSNLENNNGINPVIKPSKDEIKTLYVETAATFFWQWGCNHVPIFLENNSRFIEDGTNNNAYLNIIGTKGSSTLTFKSGGNATMTDIENITFWGGVIKYDDETYKPVLVLNSNKSANTIEIYPPLEKDITNGELGNMAVDGMHLSRRGYKAYMQHAYNSIPKYCEKDKYLEKFMPSRSIDEPIPFKKIENSGRLTMTISKVNNTSPFRRNYSTNAFQVENPWDSLLEQKSGVEWEINIQGYKGYFETFISGGIYKTNLFKDKGFELYIEWYLDNKLIKQIIKKTNEIERFCFDFENSTTAKIVIYYNKVRSGDNGEGIVIGDSTFWISNYNYGDKLIPKFSNVSQLFDSWGEFHKQASAKEFSRLINLDAGVTVPYSNTSKGSQTSAWGKSWWYENVKTKNPSIMITDFAINDGNSTTSDNFPPTVIGSDGLEYNNLITEDIYVQNLNDIFLMCKVNGIQPIMFLGCMGTYEVGAWAFKLTEGIKVGEEVKPVPPPTETIKPIEIKNKFIASNDGLDSDFQKTEWGNNTQNTFAFSIENNTQKVNILRQSIGGIKVKYPIKSTLKNSKKYFIIVNMSTNTGKAFEGMNNICGSYATVMTHNKNAIFSSETSNGSNATIDMTIGLNDSDLGNLDFSISCIRIFDLEKANEIEEGIISKSDTEIYNILKDKY